MLRHSHSFSGASNRGFKVTEHPRADRHPQTPKGMGWIPLSDKQRATSMCFHSMSFMTFGKCILLETGELLYSKTLFHDRRLFTSRVQSAISSQSPLNKQPVLSCLHFGTPSPQESVCELMPSLSRALSGSSLSCAILRDGHLLIQPSALPPQWSLGTVH